MENHHANGKTHYFKGHVSHYQRVNHPHSIPFNHHFPMVFLWFSYGLPGRCLFFHNEASPMIHLLASQIRRSTYGVNHWLVVEPTPLENMKVNWDDYSKYMDKKKGSKPPIRSIRYIIIYDILWFIFE